MLRSLVLFFSLGILCPAVEGGKLRVIRTSHDGWNDCVRMSNGLIDLVACPGIGGRVVHFSRTGKTSILLVNPEAKGKSPPRRDKPQDGGIWHPWGAFLWIAPETPASFLFNEPYTAVITKDQKLVMTGQPVPFTNTRKRIEIQMAEDKPKVRLDFFLTNVGTRSIRHALWCSFIVPNGGTVVAPTSAKSRFKDGYRKMHPFGLDQVFRTDRHLILKRLPAFKGYMEFGADPEEGWIAYHGKEDLFYKEFPVFPGREYDGQCPIKIYSDVRFTELESLSPLYEIGPGQTVSYWETWSLY